jgi:hypothetical protein
MGFVGGKRPVAFFRIAYWMDLKVSNSIFQIGFELGLPPCFWAKIGFVWVCFFVKSQFFLKNGEKLGLFCVFY